MKRSVISNGAWNAAAKFSSSGKVNAMARCNIALIIGDYIPSHLTNIRFLRIGNRQPKPQIHLFRTRFFLLLFDFHFSLFCRTVVSGVVYIAFQLCKIAINRTDYAGQLLLSIYPLSFVLDFRNSILRLRALGDSLENPAFALGKRGILLYRLFSTVFLPQVLNEHTDGSNVPLRQSGYVYR